MLYSICILLGSLVIILSLLTDPFIQQVVTYHVESKTRDAFDAKIPVAYRYSKGDEVVRRCMRQESNLARRSILRIYSC